MLSAHGHVRPPSGAHLTKQRLQEVPSYITASAGGRHDTIMAASQLPVALSREIVAPALPADLAREIRFYMLVGDERGVG